MKMWNAPVMQELDVKLTASSGRADTTEHGASLNPFIPAGYDSSIYEKTTSDDCVVPITHESCASVES